MRILKIELQQIKSYQEQTIEFADGINAICGENGSGKSTLLEGIGLALFDYNPYAQLSQFVRHGQRNGEISVLVEGKDEREYIVRRRLVGEKGSGAGAFEIFDKMSNLKLASSKTDYLDWLYRLLDVPAGTSLDLLFKDVVGVPQGLLTTVFLESPAQRKVVFDPLLRVDEYRRAREGLLETVRLLEGLLSRQKEEIARCEGTIARLPAVDEALRTLAGAIEVDRSRCAEIQGLLVDLRREMGELDRRAEKVSELSRQEEQLAGLDKTTRQRLDELNHRHEKAQEAGGVCARSLAGYEAFLEAQAAFDRVEEQRVVRDRIASQISQIERQLDRLEDSLTDMVSQAQEIEAAKKLLVELGPALEHLFTLEKEMQELHALHSRRRSLEAERNRARQALQEKESRLAGIMAEIAELERWKETAGRRSELERDIAILQAMLEANSIQLKGARSYRQAVKGGQCPFLEEDCRNMAEGMSLTAYFDQHIATLTKQQGQLKEQNRVLADQLEAARKAEEFLKSRGELSNEVHKLEGSIEADHQLLDKLLAEWSQSEDVAGRLQDVQEQIEKLKPSRDQATLAGDKAAQEAKVEKARQELTRAIASLESEIQELANEQEQFAGLDQQLATTRLDIQRHTAAYQAYLSAREMAAQESALRRLVEELRGALEQIALELQHCRAQRETAGRLYDAARHQNVREHLRRAEIDLARAEERLSNAKAQYEKLQKERDSLLEHQSRLKELHVRLREDEALLAFVRFSRDTIARAGPVVTRTLVHHISAEAAKTFSEITGDHSLHLSWDEEYEISVEKGGSHRTFRQLSGGEEVAAALAVRLALLRNVAGVDFAFFDEPTINLDERRRDHLADQIAAVQGIRQLFVISHDDTFGRLTENTIHIQKIDDVSRAVRI